MDQQQKSRAGEAQPDNTYFSSDSEDVQHFGAHHIIGHELADIKTRREQHNPEGAAVNRVEDLCGLALSGGGIRSASFSLGVMQALAYNRWLKEFDYLSTVSGGGYIGCGLSWALNSPSETGADEATDRGVSLEPSRAFGLTPDTFPYASFPMSGDPQSDCDRQPVEERVRQADQANRGGGRLLHFLRQNANYLVPGDGLNFCTLLWVALRGVTMGLFVYGGLLSLFFFLAIRCPLLDPLQPVNSLVLFALCGFGFCLVTIPLYAIIPSLLHEIQKTSWGKGWSSYTLRSRYEKFSGYVLPVLLGILLVGLIPQIHLSLVSDGIKKTENTQVLASVAFSAQLDKIGAVAWDGKLQSPNQDAEIKRDEPSSEKKNFWTQLLNETTALFTGIGSALLGLVAAVASLKKNIRSESVKLPLQPLVIVGVSALLFAILLVAYTVADVIVKTTDGFVIWRILVVGVLLVARYTNINLLSIHRYYRDRLMDTFMPDVSKVTQQKYETSAHSGSADTWKLQQLTQGMYHIINTNVILAQAKQPKYKSRGGDSFILTPRYCGSNATGWQSTKSFMEGGMTLATAMAISGAAINPSAGCGGEGVTRHTALSILMGLLNFRLGYWVPNPRKFDHPRRATLRNPNFFNPGLYEILLRTCLNEKRSYLQLSDGGHFENLGLYELIRRRLRLIVVCDAGEDARYSFSDLANAMQKIRTDFGAMIMLENKDLAPLIPQDNATNGEIGCAQQGHLIATIKYADNSTGTLIYLTTTFFKGLSADLYGYKKAHPAFPDESTGDQIFDEKQFEAYRELGFQTAWRMMNCVEQDADLYKQLWPAGVA